MLAAMAAGESSALVAPEAMSLAQAGLTKRCPRCGERYPADFRVCPRDAVELELLVGEVDDPYLGATLAGSYRIDSVIADGGMGRVYEARHTRLPERGLAVKILHRNLAGDVEVVSRFRREAEIADAIDHPNVCRVYDVQNTPDGVPFIVSELLRGEDLGQRLERVGRMSIADTVHILGQVCDVLAAVHARGVIHRDLKPNNLYLVGDPARPTVKLIDFGIARLRGPDDAKATQTGVVMGTPAYMAPEQARGERVDARADIYAVGAIAYCCVTGRGPYDLNDAAAALHAVLMSEPPRPRSVAPKIAAGFAVIAARPASQGRPLATALPAVWRSLRAMWDASPEIENATVTPACWPHKRSCSGPSGQATARPSPTPTWCCTTPAPTTPRRAHRPCCWGWALRRPSSTSP